MCFSVCANVVVAQEETEYSYGTVSNVSTNKIVVVEYDLESDEEVDVTYVINPSTKIINVNSINDISAGDSVDISYEIVDGKNVAATNAPIEAPRTSREYSLAAELETSPGLF